VILVVADENHQGSQIPMTNRPNYALW